MDRITVSKADLMETLKSNQREHNKQYEAALKQYRKQLVAELDYLLERARKGKTVSHYLKLAIPEQHDDSFKTAIEMLEWSVSDTVELDQRDFQRFVQNEWEWKQSWHANTASYLPGS
jgi:hypothetical protein